jgi:hypothetical protein
MGVRSGVLQRAIAAGFSPSAAAISRTVSLNEARQREQISAIKEVTSAVKALPAGIRNALGGFLYNPNKPSRPSKDDRIRPVTVQDTQSRREYAVGEYDVPFDMAAKIHKGEMILPASFAGKMRRALSFAGKRADDYRPPRAYNPDDFSQSMEGKAAALARARLLNLHSRAVGPDERSHAMLSRLVGGRELRDPRFVSSAVLDPSQIQDRRGSSYLMARMREYRYLHRDQSGNGDRLHITVRPSIRDTNTAQDIRGRWGRTPTQVGAA